MEYKNKIQDMTLTAVLAVLIVVSGVMRIPSIIPGSEFQMSAPIAVVIASCFGFKRYITSGIIASVISLLLGMANFCNVVVAMVFRVVAGGILALAGVDKLTLTVGGPVGTLIARIVLAWMLKADAGVLIIASAPGMVFTAITANILYPLINRILLLTEFKKYLVKQEKRVDQSRIKIENTTGNIK